MPIVTESGRSFETAKDVAAHVAPRMARKLAENQRDAVLQQFAQQPGGRAGPQPDTWKLFDSMKVQQVPSKKTAAQIVAEFYWKFALEFGSWLQVPARRIDPPRIVSDAREETLKIRDKLLGPELKLFVVRVGSGTGGAL